MPEVEEILNQNQKMTFFGFASRMREDVINLLALVKNSNEEAYSKDCMAKTGAINLIDELINFVTKGHFSDGFDFVENYDGVVNMFFQVRSVMFKSIEKQRDLLDHLKETKAELTKILSEKEKEYTMVCNMIRGNFATRLQAELEKAR